MTARTTKTSATDVKKKPTVAKKNGAAVTKKAAVPARSVKQTTRKSLTTAKRTVSSVSVSIRKNTHRSRVADESQNADKNLGQPLYRQGQRWAHRRSA